MKNTIVLYHDDPDGWLSGFFAKLRLNVNGVDYFPVNYGNKVFLKNNSGYTPSIIDHFRLISDYSKIYILDFCLDVKNLVNFAQNNDDKEIIVIDHHISNISKINELYYIPDNLKFVVKDGIGACRLCFEYFNISNLYNRITKLISEYDVWIFHNKNDKKVKLGLVNYLIRKKDMLRNLEFDDIVFNLDSCISFGIKSYYEWLYQKIDILKDIGFEGVINFNGKKYSYFAVCGKGFNSLPFEEYDSECKYDLWIAFFYAKNNWNVSLYSKKIDTSLISKSMGGGGHIGASGFQCNTLTLKEFLGIK